MGLFLIEQLPRLDSADFVVVLWHLLNSERTFEHLRALGLLCCLCVFSDGVIRTLFSWLMLIGSKPATWLPGKGTASNVLNEIADRCAQSTAAVLALLTTAIVSEIYFPLHAFTNVTYGRDELGELEHTLAAWTVTALTICIVCLFVGTRIGIFRVGAMWIYGIVFPLGCFAAAGRLVLSSPIGLACLPHEYFEIIGFSSVIVPAVLAESVNNNIVQNILGYVFWVAAGALSCATCAAACLAVSHVLRRLRFPRFLRLASVAATVTITTWSYSEVRL
jgi:hypothetical protein